MIKSSDELATKECEEIVKSNITSKKSNEPKCDFWILNYSELSLRDLPKLSQEKLLCYELKAAGNKISYINPDIQKLRLLTTVDLRLRYLKSLMLMGNMLSNIPNEIENLKVLEELDIQANQFREFPEAVCNLCSLRILSAAKNPFGLLPLCECIHFT
ncbi:hypothetical protein FGIG_12463 [Fasciola gigantica]|uniref:Uncharacterized protein n=1 Tax=Fasciola gigantica TaxID=46835 RepID=A0A504YWV8_FASGI|nr:hypothetical protein FGIG_12463 [Fasciola gigantica]